MNIAILLLNWNGWKDTIECLESVFRLNHTNFCVIVCDNASVDGSLEKIKLWADGHLAAPDFGVALPPTSKAPSKPIPWVEYTRAQAEAGGLTDDTSPLVLIQTGANLGFAGGNNVGLRYASSRKNFDYVWILNNDTIVEPDSLTHLVTRMREKPKAGICGSTLIFYHQPHVVQALGGAEYNEQWGYVTPIGMFQPAEQACSADEIEHRMAYVVGASMLVSMNFIQDIGLMSEDYFLYFEEIDWAFRAKGKYTLAFSSESKVYHKEGSSIGSSSTANQSMLATKYLYRNRIIFIKKFFKRTRLLSCLLRISWEMLVMLKRQQFNAVNTAMRSVVSALFSSAPTETSARPPG
ncbi:MAG: glycosyltransferase family 2 protein [Burkholderiales bacterium]|nr:glycosyltransferase family 2 protein [Burkholderiales bacterium]